MSNQIRVSIKTNRIVVGDRHRRYSFPANEPARNQYGQETGNTWAEEFELGHLAAVTDEDSDMFGVVVARE